jgi:hypothetical protein
MEYNVSDLKREARVAIDMNMSSQPLAALQDVDTLSLEDIIESKIADAARIVESMAPVHLLDAGEPFAETIGWDSAVGYGGGHIILPSDFLRLVSFQMSDWDYAVTTVITEDDPLYPQQRSRFPGIRGCPQRPVVALVQRPVGLTLEFYSCTGGEEVYVTRARYIPIPKITNGKIDICEKLKPSVVYYIGYLTALSVGDSDLAASMLNNSNELMK